VNFDVKKKFEMKNVVGCSMYEAVDRYVHFGWAKLKERDHLEDIGVLQSIILKRILNK
jgi:hypothetical protein